MRSKEQKLTSHGKDIKELVMITQRDVSKLQTSENSFGWFHKHTQLAVAKIRVREALSSVKTL